MGQLWENVEGRRHIWALQLWLSVIASPHPCTGLSSPNLPGAVIYAVIHSVIAFGPADKTLIWISAGEEALAVGFQSSGS